MKPFDDKLADNVRETFDNWREQVPDGAWAKMRSKLGNAKNPKVTPFWRNPSKVAAISLLAAATVALLMVPIIFLNNKTDSTRTSSLSDNSEEIILTETELESRPSIALQQNDILPEATSSFAKEEKLAATTKHSRPTTIVAHLPKEEPAHQKPVLSQGLAQNFDRSKTINYDEEALVTQKETTETIPIAKEQADEPAFAVDVTKDNIPLDIFPFEVSKASRFSWAISATPMMTFADNQPNPLPGLAAGVSAGYKLSDMFSLEVGGFLSYNQLNIANEATFRIVENISSFYAGQNATASNPIFSGNNKYNLIALEIPANIQFNIFDGPGSRFFVSTGLSSMVYLHQSVSGINHVHLKYDSNGTEMFSSTTLFIDDSFGPFSRIDLAKILNLSVGYVFLGKSNSLVVEPFLKLSLGDISSGNLSLGMGGVNLKILFSRN